MSRLVLNIDNLRVISQQNAAKQDMGSVRCRLIAQLVDIIYLDPSDPASSGRNYNFCKLLVKNLSGFPNVPSDLKPIRLNIDEDVYRITFVEGIPTIIQKGNPLDIKVVSWGSNEGGINEWEILDIKALSVKEVRDLSKFFKSDEGRDFLKISDPL